MTIVDAKVTDKDIDLARQIMPALQKQLDKYFPDDHYKVVIDNDGDSLLMVCKCTAKGNYESLVGGVDKVQESSPRITPFGAKNVVPTKFRSYLFFMCSWHREEPPDGYTQDIHTSWNLIDECGYLIGQLIQIRVADSIIATMPIG